MNKVNHFPALTASRPHFFKNLCNTDEVGLVANFNKISLAKGTARSINLFLPKLLIILPHVLQINPPV